MSATVSSRRRKVEKTVRTFRHLRRCRCAAGQSEASVFPGPTSIMTRSGSRSSSVTQSENRTVFRRCSDPVRGIGRLRGVIHVPVKLER